MAFEKELQACQDNLSKLLNRAHGGEINPFRGLEFFDAEHAPFFHGRTKTARKVLDVLEKQAAEKKPFVLVLGPDGSGKTSLVRAGILPVLTQIGIIERGSSWRLALARPADRGSGDPFDALAAPLLKESALPEFPDAASPNAWQNLAAELREAPENTALRLREALQHLSVPASDRFLDEQGFEVPRADVEESVELPRPNRLGRVNFIQKGLFHTEKGPNAEVLVSLTQECPYGIGQKFGNCQNEDLTLLRMRDRVEPNFKLWLSRGRRGNDLLRNRSSTREAKALLRSFRASLSATEVEYLQKSLGAQNRHRWVRSAVVLAAVAMAQQAKKDTALVTNQRDVRQNQLKDSEAKAQQAQEDVTLVTGERDKLQGQLKDSDVKAQQAQKNLELVTSQRDALQTQLKDAETKAQQAQKDAALAASQRDALQTQLKDTEAKAQQAQKNVELVTSQRDALRTQLAGLSAETQQAQKNKTISSADPTGPIGIKADPMQKNEPMSRDQEPAKLARIDPSQTAVPPPTPSAAVSLESTPEAQTGGSTKTSTELPLKEFVFEYIRTVASNDPQRRRGSLSQE